MWIPPHGDPAERHFGGGRRSAEQYAIYRERAELVRANDELIDSLRPAEPHWYLDTLATNPERFGQGLAARLVEHGLARLDESDELIALDVHTARNRRFYERFGFEATGSGRLPGERLEVEMMIRRPLSRGGPGPAG